MPKENQSSPSPIVMDQEIQCDLCPSEIIVPIEIDCQPKNNDRRSILQHQMDEKEKQMNRIIGRIFFKYIEKNITDEGRSPTICIL